MSTSQFPIGPLQIPEAISREDLDKAIQVLKVFPAQLKLRTQNLTNAQLEMPYRDGSWTISQLVHHMQILIIIAIIVSVGRSQKTRPSLKRMIKVYMQYWKTIRRCPLLRASRTLKYYIKNQRIF